MREYSMKSAIVTGPTGAVGSALCAYLLEKGVRVYAVVRPGSKRVSNLPEGVSLVPCDLTQLHRLRTLVPEGADVFFHLAWAHTIGAGRNDMNAQIENIRYAVDAVQAAADLGCGVFVGAGSQAEYGRVEGKLTAQTPCFPENGYGMAKLCAGEMTRVECAKHGLRHQWVRILSVYGPHDTDRTMISMVIEKLLRREKPALTEGLQQWDYLYAGDAAAALYSVACHGCDGRIYPVGSGQARPLREYIEILRNQIDPSLPLGFGELPYSSGQVMFLQADISSLTRDTGWAPRVAFEDGIRYTIENYRKTHLCLRLEDENEESQYHGTLLQ